MGRKGRDGEVKRERGGERGSKEEIRRRTDREGLSETGAVGRGREKRRGRERKHTGRREREGEGSDVPHNYTMQTPR